jgi:DNA-binding HxlR family transcriptional regulator
MEHRAAAVASRAVKLALTEGAFKAGEVRRGLARPPSKATVTRVLRQLEDDGWLQREVEGSSIWRAGFQARALGDLSERAIEAADREAVEPGEDRGREPGSFDFEL